MSSSRSASISSASGESTSSKTAQEETIASDLVVTKYKMASEITQRVLREVIDRSVPGASAKEICIYGDKRLDEETSRVFKKDKDVKKGIAFPTCLSVNNYIGHFSPLVSDPDMILKDNDVVKIDLGCHVDGYIAVVAHTIVVGATREKKVTGRRADCILAAYYAAEAALRLIKPNETNLAVTEMIDRIANVYHCKPVEGMVSYQMSRGLIDGEKKIFQNPTEMQRREIEKQEFALHEVYAIDILVSSGEGKPRETDLRTTVFKKKEFIYQLRMKSSRVFLSEVEKRFALMPFTLRNFEDEKRARMGVIECAKHDLVEPYPIYQEKDGEFVAEFKFTVLLMPNGQMKITGLPLDFDLYESEFKITDSNIKQLLNSSAQKKKNKKKKKNKGNGNQNANAATGESIEAVDDDGDEDFEDEPDEVTKKPSASTTSKKPKSNKA
jgi:curved DNA binding protein